MTVFGVIIYDCEGYRTNLSEDIKLHRVSRNPGGDFSFLFIQYDCLLPRLSYTAKDEAWTGFVGNCERQLRQSQ
jgi:hypothetical protein